MSGYAVAVDKVLA